MPWKDPEVAKQKKREYYLKYKDKVIERSKKWSEENPEKRKKIWQKYNKKKSTKIYKTLWWENKAYNGNATILNSSCEMCDTLENLVIHHNDGCNGKLGKPLNNNPENLIILCRSCHPKVHNKHWVKKVRKQ